MFQCTRTLIVMCQMERPRPKPFGYLLGDALAAWNALNLEGTDILSEREMDFLDDMELDMLAAYVSATQAAEENEAEKHKVGRKTSLTLNLDHSALTLFQFCATRTNFVSWDGHFGKRNPQLFPTGCPGGAGSHTSNLHHCHGAPKAFHLLPAGGKLR